MKAKSLIGLGVLASFLVLLDSFIVLGGISHPGPDADAYFHLRMLEYISANHSYPTVDVYSSYPGRPFYYAPGYHYTLYVLSLILGVYTSWKYAQLIFIGASAVIIFLLGSRMFDARVGALSMFFLVSSPFVLVRDIKADNECFFIFLAVLSAYFVMAYNNSKSRFHILCLGVVSGVFAVSWSGFIFFTTVCYLTLFAAMAYTSWRLYKVPLDKSRVFSLLLLIIIPSAVYLSVFSPDSSTLQIQSLFQKASAITQQDTSVTKYFALGVGELGKPDILLFVQILGVVSLIIPFAFLSELVRLRKGIEFNTFFMLVWFTLSLPLSMLSARNLIFPLIPVIVLSAKFIVELPKHQSIMVLAVVALSLIYVVVLYGVSPQLLNLNPNVYDSMVWITGNAKDKVFMNYWQVGHLISYAGGRNVIDGLMYVNGSEQRAYELHKFWVDDEKTSWAYMRTHGIDYVYVSKDYIVYSPTIVAIGTNGTHFEGYGNNYVPDYLSNSVLTHMMSGGKNLKCFTNSYRNPDVAIYKPTEVCL